MVRRATPAMAALRLTSAELQNPGGIAMDSSGNLYIADTFNYRIRKVYGLDGNHHHCRWQRDERLLGRRRSRDQRRTGLP